MAAPHAATVVWTRGTDDFLDKRYHRSHQWQFDGGATVAASSSPHVVPLPYSDASAVDPEEAYIAALASCHMLWFLDLASRAGWRVNRYTDAAEGTMAKDAEGRLVVSAFYPMNLLQKLSLLKEEVDDWRQLVESIMVDWNYDGAVLTPAVVDLPGKNELVAGSYAVPDDAGTIRIKITDLLSESLEMEVNNG